MTAGGGQSRGVALVVTAAMLFGASAIFAKLSYDHGAGVLTVIAARYLGGLVIVAPLARWKARGAWRGASTQWRWLALGVVNVGAAGGYLGALSLDAVGRVAPIVFTFPVLSAALGWALFRVPLGRRLAVALVIGLTGTMLVFGEGVGVPEKLAAGLLALGTAVVSAAYFVFAARWSGAPWLPMMATIFAMGTLVFVPLAIGTGSSLPSGRGWLWIGCLVAFGSAVPYLLQIAGMSVVGSTKAGVLAMIEPMLSVLAAMAVLGERMSGLQGAGAALVLVSFALASAPGLRRRRGRAAA